MSFNVWSRFQSLNPQPALLVGHVIAHDDDGVHCTVAYLNGYSEVVTGQDVAIDHPCFVRDGVVLGPASELTVVEFEI